MDGRGRHNREKTHCIRGHAFTSENTIVRRDGRECRECVRIRNRVGHKPYEPAVITKPAEIDLAWVAGFMDGEGCFALASNKGKPDWNRRPMMTATQKRIAPITKLQAMFGGSIRPAGAGGGYFQWHLNTQEMVVVIPWLVPHLVLKKEEAEIVLAYATTVKRSRPGRRTVGQDEIAYRQILVDRLRKIRSQDG
jgi:LAGLIDADG endonuclease